MHFSILASASDLYYATELVARSYSFMDKKGDGVDVKKKKMAWGNGIWESAEDWTWHYLIRWVRKPVSQMNQHHLYEKCMDWNLLVKMHELLDSYTWFWNPAPPLKNYETLGELSNLCEPLFSYL